MKEYWVNVYENEIGMPLNKDDKDWVRAWSKPVLYRIHVKIKEPAKLKELVKPKYEQFVFPYGWLS